MSSCLCKSKEVSCPCQDIISAKRKADNPLQLMRSRYVAFATGASDYLYQTSSNKLKLELTEQDLKAACMSCHFIGLTIVEATDTTVEFKADFIADGYLQQIHEQSNFVIEDEHWKYDSGELFDTPIIKIERNEQCPCGSGKKFKKCHAK